MRPVAVLLVTVALGCGKKDEPPAGAPTPAKVEQPLIRNWKPHTVANLRIKAEFPWGDPNEDTIFARVNKPRAVAESEARWIPITPKERGQENHIFGLRGVRFRESKSADRATILAHLFADLPPKGWTGSAPKAVQWAGQQATETTWTDPTKPTTLIVRQFEAPDYAYVGYVRDTGGLPPASVTRFFDSVQLLDK